MTDSFDTDVADVPPIPQILWPLLRALAEGGDAAPRREIFERAAVQLGLTEAQLTVRIPSGKVTRYAHRTGWALQHLKHAGLVRSSAPGQWGLTPEGRVFVTARPNGLVAADVAMLMRATGVVRVPGGGGGRVTVPEAALASIEAEDDTTPEEQIEGAVAVLRANVAEELLERLLAGTPSFFEHVVTDLLKNMGYGASRDDLRRVVGSGDGGIDGIMSVDRLGLEKVYVQAKRWKGTVGRPEIQGFFGALHGRHANKGVFITTSRFTLEARDFATSVSDTIVLIDGEWLTNLMIEFGVGVSLRPVNLPYVDTDYFTDP